MSRCPAGIQDRITASFVALTSLCVNPLPPCVSAATLLPPGQQAGALLLGVVNVVGVITLSTLLVDPVAKLALYRQGLGFILGLLPYLQTYAAAFFALPALRLFVDGRRNAAIEDRNDNRVEVRPAFGVLLCVLVRVLEACQGQLATLQWANPVVRAYAEWCWLAANPCSSLSLRMRCSSCECHAVHDIDMALF